MSVEVEFSRDDIKELLEELGRRLLARNVTGTIYVAGGAAIALEFPERRVTRDIDALFGPAQAVREEADAMAAERGLAPTWLSDSVRAFMPSGDDAQATTYSVPGLDVSVASPRYLLAMKMAAGRPQDLHDLILIFRELGITQAVEAADIAQEVHGSDSVLLPPRDELILYAEGVLNRMEEPPD
ncbi:MAG: hypothetical protein U9N56_09310 [Actinomycetota bacterium]|nr:hypothetical protein [Actinomycetota bacterium]